MNFLLQDIVISFMRVVAWTTVSYLVGVVIGYCCYSKPLLQAILMPVINFFRHISPFCWLPLIILVAGIGEWPVGIVLLFSMVFNAIVISSGIFGMIPRDLLDTASLDAASQNHILIHIILPISLPELVNLYRVLWSVGWTAIIAAEMLGVQSGMGYRLLDFRYLLKYREMLIYIALIGCIGILADYLLVRLQKQLKKFLYESTCQTPVPYSR